MILIGLGGNLPGKQGESPVETLESALDMLAENGPQIIDKSPWYKSAPVPVSDQPWFVNGVASLESKLGPREILDILLAVEATFGRARGERNEARAIDLDLLDYRGQVRHENGLVLPHPRMAERLFVLKPLSDIAPAWKHPETGKNVTELMEELGTSQKVEIL